MAAALWTACSGGPAVDGGDRIPLGDDVFVERLGDGVYRHVSLHALPNVGPVPSNGLLFAGTGGTVLVDTAWTPEQTARLLDWAGEAIGPVSGLIVTHSHGDRMGGIAETRRRGIESYALEETQRLARSAGSPGIDHGVESPYALSPLGIDGELFSPGAGHTDDNAVVWLAGPRVLFGGCLVRSAGARDMGNTADGDLDAWPHSIAAVQVRYPKAAIVVPGHGEPGGEALLRHTLDLLARHPPSQ